MQTPTPSVEFVNFPHLARQFYLEPIALEQSAMLAIHAYLWPRITGEVETMQAISAADNAKPYSVGGTGAHRRPTLAAPATTGDGYFTPRVVTDPRYFYTLEGKPGVAVVPINGMIMKGASSFQESCMGAVSTERITHAIAQATADKNIKTLALDIGSPGGQVTGISELAQMIKSFGSSRGRNVYAFTDTMAASAAYWLASQANEIVMTQSAQVGSIGTYLAFLNENVRMQTQGVKLELFKAGTHKGLGLPGNDLTQADRAYLQSRVEDLNTQFVSAVEAGRPKISQDAVTHAAMYPGISTMSGASALDHRMADGLVSSWEEFVSLL